MNAFRDLPSARKSVGSVPTAGAAAAESPPAGGEGRLRGRGLRGRALREHCGARGLQQVERSFAARDAADGPGVVVGDIEIGAVAQPAPRTDRFWIPCLTVTHLGNWYHQNAAGRSYYLRMRRPDHR